MGSKEMQCLEPITLRVESLDLPVAYPRLISRR